MADQIDAAAAAATTPPPRPHQALDRTLLAIMISGPVADFYREPAVRWILIVFAVASAVGSLQTLPRAVLARRLKFRTIALLDGIDGLTVTITTLTLALAGLRYRALVYGLTASAVLTTIIALTVAPY